MDNTAAPILYYRLCPCPSTFREEDHCSAFLLLSYGMIMKTEKTELTETNGMQWLIQEITRG